MRADAARHRLLFVGLVIMVVAQPLLVHASEIVAQVFDTAFGVLDLGIFLALCRTRWERRTGILLFVPVVVANLAMSALPGELKHVVIAAFHGAVAVFLGFAVAVIVRLLARTSVIRTDDVMGAVSGYILAALAWSHLYALAYILAPDSFRVDPAVAAEMGNWRGRRVLFEYLSFTTLTSIGFSDVTPAGPPMYSLTWMETIFGQFYMAVVVAQLVGLKLAQAMNGRRERG